MSLSFWLTHQAKTPNCKLLHRPMVNQTNSMYWKVPPMSKRLDERILLHRWHIGGHAHVSGSTRIPSYLMCVFFKCIQKGGKNTIHQNLGSTMDNHLKITNCLYSRCSKLNIKTLARSTKITETLVNYCPKKKSRNKWDTPLPNEHFWFAEWEEWETTP